MQLTRSSQREVWVLGNLFVLTGRSQPAIRGMQIVYLAALSVEDIEDIYLFGSMITGILLIGLGFALGYRVKIDAFGDQNGQRDQL